MAQFVMFMPRQTVMGGSAGTTLYSEVFDVAGVKELSGFLHSYASDAAGNVYTAGIEMTDESSMSGFASGVGFASITVTGVSANTGWGAQPKRFVRGFVTIPAGKFAIVEFYARGF